jgi:anti-anti-sigma regulatory factor
MLSDGGAAFAAERTTLSDGTAHILVSGTVDAGASCEFLDVLIGEITPGRTTIVDLASVTYIDDTSTAALAVAHHVAALHGGELRVLGCTGEAECLMTKIRSGLVHTMGPERQPRG